MRTLHDLTAEALQLFEKLEQFAEENEGRVSPDLDAECERLGSERTAKIAAICSVYKEMSARADVLDAEAKRIQKRAKAAQNQADALKSYLAFNLKAGEKIEVGTHRVGWRKSSSVELVPGVAVEDIPELYQRRKLIVEFAKDEATRGIKAGEDLWFAQNVEKMNIQIG